MFVDADAHVEECADTWSYFPKSMEDLRPIDIALPDQPPYLQGLTPRAGTLIDGQVMGRFLRDDEDTHSTEATRGLSDIPGRLKVMDEMNIDIQVLYPSVLLFELTRRPELEVALCESYNRWVADRCKESDGRLQWTAVLPLRSMPDALREMRRVKEDGAVGIFKRSWETDNRHTGDLYFHPAYELTQELDLPICIHVSGAYQSFPTVLSKLQKGIFMPAASIDAFVSYMQAHVPAKFPRLRMGIIEVASGWLPYALWLLSFEHLATNKKSQSELSRGEYERVLHECNLFITCEADENLPSIIDQVGDNNLGIGTDHGHSDRSGNLEAHRLVVERTDIDSETAKKLTDTNARTFYGLA